MMYVYSINISMELNLKQWQLEILKIIDENKPNRRDVYWIYDTISGTGKTFMSTWLNKNRGSLTVGGNCRNTAHELSKIKKINFPKIIVIDIPSVGKKEYLDYWLLDYLKNGHMCSTKWSGKIFNFDIPHVIIFSNEKPDIEKLSLDRWNIFKIKDGTLHKKEIEIDEESSEIGSDYESVSSDTLTINTL